MAEKALKKILAAIMALSNNGTLHINRLKDPNSDCQVDIKVGATTYYDCNELVNHYRNEYGMLAYTTTELIEKENSYYYLEIRDYTKGTTVKNQYQVYTILKCNSCVTGTARTW